MRQSTISATRILAVFFNQPQTNRAQHRTVTLCSESINSVKAPVLSRKPQLHTAKLLIQAGSQIKAGSPIQSGSFRSLVLIEVTKSRNRKLIRVTSSNEGLKDKCVDLSDCNRYLNQIWYRAQIPHYQHAGMPNSHNLTIQDGGCRHLQFQKNVNNSGLNKDICTKFYKIQEDASQPCGDDHMTKSRNRKLIRVTSSNKCHKHQCVDLGDYNILNQIWYTAQIPHYQHARITKLT